MMRKAARNTKSQLMTWKQYKRKFNAKERSKHVLRFAGVPIVIDDRV